MWNIRYKIDEEEGLVGFVTKGRDIQLRQRDLLVLDFKKLSKGTFGKSWTGEWDKTPIILTNITLGGNAWKI
ncbi:MAG: hypothetical protein ACTSSE_17315 [Candidatus Thorarchaeota archaeon]